MTEKQFENQVNAYLAEQGCWTLKTWSNGVQREGVPDLLVCCHGHFIAVELKAEKGRPSKLQLWNISKIREANGVAIVLYPDQFEAFKSLIQMLKSKIIDKRVQYSFDRKGFDEGN
jgi:Holliday junction resolvase